MSLTRFFVGFVCSHVCPCDYLSVHVFGHVSVYGWFVCLIFMYLFVWHLSMCLSLCPCVCHVSVHVFIMSVCLSSVCLSISLTGYMPILLSLGTTTATSHLVGVTKTVAPTSSSPLCQEQLIIAAKQVAGAVEGTVSAAQVQKCCRLL